MTMWRASVAIWWLAANAVTASAQAISPADARYTISAIDDKLRADAPVGRRESGLLCTPAGQLSWRDARPDPASLQQDVVAMFADAGVPVTVRSDDDFSSSIRTPFRITVTIAQLRVRSCTPWRGIRIGKQAGVKASGRIAIIWRVFDQKRRVLAIKASICRDFVGTDGARDLPRIVSSAVAASGKDVAPLLIAQDPSRPGEIVIGCTVDEQKALQAGS